MINDGEYFFAYILTIWKLCLVFFHVFFPFKIGFLIEFWEFFMYSEYKSYIRYVL